MRKFLFGWICRLRGMHRSGKKAQVSILYPQFLLEFACICGTKIHRNADVERGGRIPVPFEWPVEGKCL